MSERICRICKRNRSLAQIQPQSGSLRCRDIVDCLSHASDDALAELVKTTDGATLEQRFAAVLRRMQATRRR